VKAERGLEPRVCRLFRNGLFALNLGFLARYERDLTMGAHFGDFDFRWEALLRAHLNAQLHRSVNGRPGGWAAFAIVAAGFAVVIFAALEVLLRIPAARKYFGTVAGALSAVALPVLWLYNDAFVSAVPSGLPNPSHVGLWFEIAAVAGYFMLSGAPGARLPVWIDGGVLLVHFVFWGWLFLGGLHPWHPHFQSVFPALGFCSALAWVIWRPEGRAIS
jgi:hypothetical protein